MNKQISILLAILTLVVIIGGIAVMVYQKDQQKPITEKDKTMVEALVRPDSPSIGPAEAKVTIVEFLDPECEACAAFAPVVKKIVSENPSNIRLVVRYMPFHPNSRLAASYLEAAGEQGKYWEMMDKMFVNQAEWGEIHGHGPKPVRPPAETLFDKWAGELGLNVEQLKASAADPKHRLKVERDFADGRSLAVTKTPSFFVNGRMLARFSEGDLRALVADEMKK